MKEGALVSLTALAVALAPACVHHQRTSKVRRVPVYEMRRVSDSDPKPCRDADPLEDLKPQTATSSTEVEPTTGTRWVRCEVMVREHELHEVEIDGGGTIAWTILGGIGLVLALIFAIGAALGPAGA